jgi:hypothetical protein
VALSGTGVVATGGATASYAGADTVTHGNWTGKYGADGQLIANDLTNAPAYASVTFNGASLYTWTTSTSDVRALQASSGSTSRISSTYYSNASFTIDMNLTDGNAHKISLYLCDWDTAGRADAISIVDAASGAVLRGCLLPLRGRLRETEAAVGSGDRQKGTDSTRMPETQMRNRN